MSESEMENLSVCSGVKKEIRELANTTTAHGVPRIVGSQRREMRIIWIGVVVLAWCVFAFHFSRLFSNYLAFPISTSTSFNSIKFVFPDVTICNLLPFSLRKLERKDPGLKRFAALGDLAPEHLEDALEVLLQGTENDKFNTILTCSYNNELCSADNFTEISDPLFRSCFTFSPNEGVMANTPEYGLNLLLYAENSHAHPIIDFSFAVQDKWESSGVRLIIHDTNTRPYPALRGVNVQPGVSARFAVSMTQFNLYNIFRDGKQRCDDDGRNVSYCIVDSKEKDKEFKEIAEDCYIDVIQNLALTRCKCLSHEHAVPSVYCEKKPINSATDFCDGDTNACYKQLKDDLRYNFQALVVDQCVGTCVHRKFTKELSTSTWPSNVARGQVIKDVRNFVDYQKEFEIETTLDEIVGLDDEQIESSGLLANNFMKVCVYAESLTANEIVESPAYPLPNFISEVGGILGLWLGCSVLTLLGPLELLLNVIFMISEVKKARRNKEKVANEDVEANEEKGTMDTYADVKVELKSFC